MFDGYPLLPLSYLILLIFYYWANQYNVVICYVFLVYVIRLTIGQPISAAGYAIAAVLYIPGLSAWNQ